MPSPQLLPSDTPAAISLHENASAADASIVSRQILRLPDARVTLFSFDEGQELTPHTNTRRALVQILTGACDFFYADAWHRLAAGALLHLPPNAPHAVRATEPFTMLLTLLGDPVTSTPQPST